jgi:hypothetical protein
MPYMDVSFRVFWDSNQPERVHIASNDARFLDAEGEHAGIRLVASANPLSADYNPNVYNRAVRAWKAAGWELPAGVGEVPLKRRHIVDRLRIIIEHLNS